METIKITYPKLKALLENEETFEATIEKYFDIDNTNPFFPNYKLKANVEILEGDEDGSKGFIKKMGLNLANNISRRRRYKKYKRMKRKNRDAIRIVSEGDSWFQHPLVKDIIDHLMDFGYVIKSLGAGGDELIDMYLREEFIEAILVEQPEFLLLSAGGNDVIGGNIVYLFNQKTDNKPAGEAPHRFINNKFQTELEVLRARLGETMRRVGAIAPEVKIIIHGYDYAIPQERKGWIGKYMAEKGITDIKDKLAIIQLMIDQHNEMLAALVEEYPNVTYLDLRNTVKDNQWHDEIHPDKHGFLACAEKFKLTIENLKKEQVIA